MTLEQLSLKEEIRKGLEERGLEVVNEGINYTQYILKGESEKYCANAYGHKHIEGLTLDVCECLKHNGTQENVSFYIDAMRWSGCSGKGESRVKISQKDGIKKRTRLLDEITNYYKENN